MRLGLADRIILSERIQRLELGTVFTVSADGDLAERHDVWAPDVYDDPQGDVEILERGWEALTGMTGQYGYNGAVMHPSELVSAGVVTRLLELADDEPQAFALVTVTDPSADDDADDIVGWAIVHRTER